MKRLAAVGLLTCLLAAAFAPAPALARTGVVKTRNGQTYEGDIEEKSDGVVITTRGIQTRIASKDVASVDYEKKNPQFEEQLKKLDKSDVKGRIKLAREAFDAGQYVFARDVLEDALTIDPNSADAARFRETVLAQIRLERAKQRAGPTTQERPITPRPPGPPRPMNPSSAPGEQEKRYLRPADINAIRQNELRPEEENIPIRFERDVKRRYVTSMFHRPQEEFYNGMTPTNQAVEIIKNGAPEMRQDVKIMRDPQALLEFRRIVQPYVLQNCATSQCHGGSGGGSLMLFNPADSDQAVYTNFYILQNFSRKGATGGGPFSSGKLMMVDRTQPTKSLLLQYSIPEQLSDYDHPQVPNYRPPLRNATDSRYTQMLNWIHDSLASVSSYGITYVPPGASTHPATQSTTQPSAAAPSASPAPGQPR